MLRSFSVTAVSHSVRTQQVTSEWQCAVFWTFCCLCVPFDGDIARLWRLHSTPSSSSSWPAAAAAVVMETTRAGTTCNYNWRWRRWRRDETMTTRYYDQPLLTQAIISWVQCVSAPAAVQQGAATVVVSSTTDNITTLNNNIASGAPLPAEPTSAGVVYVIPHRLSVSK